MGLNRAHSICRSPYLLFVLLSAISLIASGSWGQLSVSRPVGFIKVVIPPNTPVLSSIPFKAFDDSVPEVMAGQLTGSTNWSLADQILKWDASKQEYMLAFKADNTGNESRNGKWFDTNWVESSITIDPGEPVWLVSRQSFTQMIYMAGEVTMDATNVLPLYPALNLVGFPYSSPVDLGKTALWSLWSNSVAETSAESADRIYTSSNSMPISADSAFGRGYWYENNSDNVILWAETRPYADVFSEALEVPCVTGLSVGEDGKQIVLTIQCDPNEDIPVDIYVQDMLVSSDCFNTTQRWSVAQMDLQSGYREFFQWSDLGAGDRLSVNEVLARYYLVVRADLDTDQDGVPDGREVFINHTDPLMPEASGLDVATVSATSLSATDESLLLANLQQSATGSNETGKVQGYTLSRVIYVDKRNGNDAFSGKLSRVEGSDGPKQTINAGLRSVEPNGQLVIKAGAYNEDLNLVGDAVSVRINGSVRLRSRVLLQTEQDSLVSSGIINTNQ